MLNFIKVTFLIFCLLSICIPVIANDEKTLIAEAVNKKLHLSPFWKALLHYESRPFVKIKASQRSNIITNDFFLSSKGKSDSQLELIATIKAYFLSETENSGRHARCVYPARYLWLKKNLSWQQGNDLLVKCEKYDRWRKKGAIDKVSLVFATGYFDNPASYYGHMLLSFHDKNNKNFDEKLLSKSLDFGAILDNSDNAVAYVFKGLFGYYDAGFTHAGFYEKNHNYGETELRDLWDYELELNQHDVDMIVAHSWEILGHKFQYFFTMQNCASAMAELIELIINQPLYDRNQPWVAPISVFHKMAKIEYKNKPLIRKITRIASRESRLKEKYQQLSSVEKNHIKKYIENELFFTERSYQNLTLIEKQKILATLLDYYQLKIIKKPNDLKLLKQKKSILMQRLSLPKNDFEWLNVPHYSPHEGQKTSQIQGSYISKNNENNENNFEFRIRPAYFDFLSNDIGRAPFTQLSMLDLKLRAGPSGVKLYNFDFVNVETMNVSTVDLDNNGYAWKFKSSYENQNLACDNCKVFSLEGGIGKALAINEKNLIFSMLDIKLQSNKNNYGTAAATPKIGMIAGAGANWKMYLSYAERYYLNSMKNKEEIYQLETRFGDATNWDIRVAFSKHIIEETKLSYSYYW